MKPVKIIALCAVLLAVAVGGFYAYGNNRLAAVNAEMEKYALDHSTTDTALSLAVYKATTNSDPLVGYLRGFQTEIDQLSAEYEAIVAEEPFFKHEYADELSAWHIKRLDLTARIKDFIEE